MSKVIETNGFVVPSDPEVRKKVAKMLQSVSDSMTKIEAERSLIRETIKELSKDTDIPKAYLNKAARMYHKNSYQAVTSDNQAIEELYEKLFPDQV